MKRIYLLLFAFSLALAATAQTFNPCVPKTFLKQIGNPQNDRTFSASLCFSNDGNLFLAVDRFAPSGSRPLLTKITPAGEVLWSRLFLRDINPRPSNIRSMTTDSEGMLVAVGSYSGISQQNHFICRYDPLRDSVLWVRQLFSQQQGYDWSKIVEKESGGDYLICRTLDVGNAGTEAELLKIGRQNGILMQAQKIGWAERTVLKSIVAYQGIFYAAGTQAYAGSAISNPLLCSMPLATSQLSWANTSLGIQKRVGNADLLIDQDTLVTLYTGSDSLPQSPVRYIYLQKTTLAGAPAWVRRYELPESIDFSAALAIVPSASGYIILGANNYSAGGQRGDFFLLATDKAGHIRQTHRIPTPPPFDYVEGAFGRFRNSAVFNDESLYLTDVFYGVDFQPVYRDFSSAVLFKTNLALTGLDGCPFAPLDFSVVESTIANFTAIPVPLNFAPSDAQLTNTTFFTESDSIEEYTTCARCDAPCGPILSLGPDQEFFADTTVLLQAGAGYVSYRWQDGSTAPNYLLATAGGTYWVEVKDGCGFVQRDTIQLSVSETVCDEKSLSCIRWELLDVKSTATGDLRFRVRVTNHCASALQKVDFQVPAGLVATYPADQSIYTAPSSGRIYTMRNPNFSPFYAVRFRAGGNTSLSNGAADIFTYELPGQAAPDYIHTAATLADGSKYEAFLNTFHCPPASAGERSRKANNLTNSILSPNPSNGTLWLHLPDWKNQALQVRILNAQGQVLQTILLADEEAERPLLISSQLVDGLYYAVVQAENEAPLTLKFVLAR